MRVFPKCTGFYTMFLLGHFVYFRTTMKNEGYFAPPPTNSPGHEVGDIFIPPTLMQGKCHYFVYASFQLKTSSDYFKFHSILLLKFNSVWAKDRFILQIFLQVDLLFLFWNLTIKSNTKFCLGKIVYNAQLIFSKELT